MKDVTSARICICMKTGFDLYVDDCKENWDILNNLDDVIKDFIYLKDSRIRNGANVRVRVGEISSFALEESDED